ASNCAFLRFRRAKRRDSSTFFSYRYRIRLVIVHPIPNPDKRMMRLLKLVRKRAWLLVLWPLNDDERRGAGRGDRVAGALQVPGRDPGRGGWRRPGSMLTAAPPLRRAW
ncbi:MAG: hypothetical protein WA077_10940, partial [Anaerolineae bacterium]